MTKQLVHPDFRCMVCRRNVELRRKNVIISGCQFRAWIWYCESCHENMGDNKTLDAIRKRLKRVRRHGI